MSSYEQRSLSAIDHHLFIKPQMPMSPPSTESERDGGKDSLHSHPPDDYMTPRGNHSFDAPLLSSRKTTSTLTYHRSSALNDTREQRVVGTQRSRGLVMVIPPASVCKDQSSLGHALSTGPVHRLSHGMLMPLLPTVYAQLTAIAKEWAFPSTVGLCLYLHITEGGVTFTPRILDETWQLMWNHVFDTTLPMTGIPVAGRIEFDIDLAKARWFNAWAKESTSEVATAIPREPSVVARHQHQPTQSSVTLSINDDTTVESEGVRTVGRHVPKKLSLVDRFDTFAPKTPAMRPLRTGMAEPSALPPIPSAVQSHHTAELNQKVNRWRADAKDAHAIPMTSVAVNGDTNVEEEEEKSEIDMNDYTWSISSAGPPSDDMGSIDSAYRLPSVHMDRRMASSVCLTASVCTSWGAGDSIYSSFEMDEHDAFPGRYGPEDCPNTPSTTWGVTPFHEVSHRSFLETRPQPTRGAFSWPYYSAERTLSWPYYTAEQTFSWPYYSAEESFSWPYYTAEKVSSWPYLQGQSETVYPHFNIYYLISPAEPISTSTVPVPSYPHFEVYDAVYPYFSLYPPVAADNMPVPIDIVAEVKAATGFWKQRTQQYPDFALYATVGYPYFDLYPEMSTLPKSPSPISVAHEGCASYPILEIYPAVYPYFNLYPEIAGKNEVIVIVEPEPDFWVQRVAAYPDFNLYPSAQYPHFDLYNEDLVLLKEEERAPAYNPGPSAVYPVIEIYAPVYPYFSLYPTAAVSAIKYAHELVEKHDFWVQPERGYPTFNLYPTQGYPDFELYPIASTSQLTLEKLAENEDSGVYPWLQIYAPVYPFVAPYPQMQGAPVRPREVTLADEPLTARLRPAASLRSRSGTVSSKRNFIHPLTLDDNRWGEPARPLRSSSRPPLSPTSANTPRSTRTYALPSASTLPSASIYEPENELPLSARSHRRNRSEVVLGDIHVLERSTSAATHSRSKSEKFDTGLTRFASLSTPTRSSVASPTTPVPIAYAARKRDSMALTIQKWRKTKEMTDVLPPLPSASTDY